MSIERSIVGKIYEGKRVDEKTYHRGNAQYWKRSGKYYKWTESGGKQEIGEADYMKALADTSATSTPEVNSKNKEEKKESSIDSKVKSMKDYVGDDEVKNLIDDSLRHNLGNGETHATVDNFKIISEPDINGRAEVEFDYSVNVRVPVGKDPETGNMEYESDTEYRKGTYNLKIAKSIPEKSDSKKSNTDSSKLSKSKTSHKEYKLGDEVSYKGDSYTIISDEDGMVTLRPSYKVDTSTFDNPEEGDSFDDIHLDKSQLGGKDSDTKKKEPSPVEQRRKDFENDESDYISYQDVRSFDHTSWYVDGFENTIVKNSDGSYYMQNEDYDMEFDTKKDLVKYLRDNDADYIGQDSENDY